MQQRRNLRDPLRLGSAEPSLRARQYAGITWAPLLASLCGCQGAGSANLHASGDLRGSATATGDVHVALRDGKLDYTDGSIDFSYDEATLVGDRTFVTLEALARYLRDNPAVEVRVEGHTDSRGSKDYNQQLSTRRAKAIREWLIAHGVVAGRLDAVGRGEDAPQSPEPDGCPQKGPASEACERAWAVNRLAIFSVTAGAARPSAPEGPAEAPPGSVAFQAALRPGFSSALDEKDRTAAQAVVFLDVGIRPIEWLFVGGYGGLGVGLAAESNGSHATLARGGVEALYMFPSPKVTPWIGLAVGGVGWLSSGRARSGGLEVTPLIGGVDFHLSRVIGLGPWVGVSFGSYDGKVSGWVFAGPRLTLFP